ncbi:hypothetical protein DFH11DRAFT_349098 [Phellopilus nigrolimitatus]|nr:hypothetical protein DFH11DRAFT_349098 [Phellopilus nigrolimitatus]
MRSWRTTILRYTRSAKLVILELSSANFADCIDCGPFTSEAFVGIGRAFECLLYYICLSPSSNECSHPCTFQPNSTRSLESQWI